MSNSFTPLYPQQAQQWIAEGAHIIDVREVDEYRGGHLPGAQNIPLALLPLRLGELPRSGKLLLVCAAGGRSASAAGFLAAQGWTADQLGNLEGGTFGWAAQGLEIEV